jgi:transcriptional regulator with XRE-family HTH domain
VYPLLREAGTEDIMRAIPAIDMAATGRNIVSLRKSAGLTVRDLQAIFGFATPQAIYKWQRGTAMPTLDNLVALAVIFGVSMDDIIAVDANAGAQRSA